MIRNGMWMAIMLSIALLTGAPVAYSQNSTLRSSSDFDLQARARELNEVYRNKAIELVSVYLTANRFYVEIDVVPRVTGNLDLPYIPKNSLNLGGNSRLMDDVQNLISSVRVVLRLPSDLSTQTQQQLSDILFRELPLDRWRGDSVSIRTFHMAAPTSPTSVPVVNARATSSNPTPGQQAIASASQNVASTGYPLNRILTAEFWEQISFWHLLGLGAAMCLGVFGLLSALLLARGLLSIGGGLRNVSGSIEKSNQTSTRARANQSQPSQRAPRSIAHAAPVQDRIMHVQTSASVERQISRMRESIKSSMSTDESVIGCAVELANRYLSRPQECSKAVVLFELIPDGIGQDIFARLGATQKRQLQLAAQNFEAGFSKPQLTLAVGDELLALTRSRALSQSESAHSHRIREYLSRTDDRDIARLLPAINADVLPRFVYYLAPQRLAKILTLVNTSDSAFSNRISWALLALPNIEDKLHLDQPVVNLLDAMQELVKRRESSRYFPHLEAVLESLPPRLRAAIADNLITMNEEFAKYMHDVVGRQASQANSSEFDPSPIAESDQAFQDDKNAA